jgi:hypothetical protein
VIGEHKPLGDAFPELIPVLTPICRQYVIKGTPKQIKQAIRCLYKNTTSTLVRARALIDISMPHDIDISHLARTLSSPSCWSW